MTYHPDAIDNSADVIDSRDVIQRIADLEEIEQRDDDEQAELDALKALQEEAEGYAPDWEYGASLIRDSYFTEYAEQLAEDIGVIDRNASWPACHIDWEAAAESLKQDYTEVDFSGVVYWVQ